MTGWLCGKAALSQESRSPLEEFSSRPIFSQLIAFSEAQYLVSVPSVQQDPKTLQLSWFSSEGRSLGARFLYHGSVEFTNRKKILWGGSETFVETAVFPSVLCKK